MKIEQEKWKKKYYEKQIVDYSKYFSDTDILLLKKLEIDIDLTKIYTEYEHDCFDMKLIEYYEDAEDIYGNKLPPEKNIDDFGVTREDYSRLLDIMYQIAVDYEF